MTKVVYLLTSKSSIFTWKKVPSSNTLGNNFQYDSTAVIEPGISTAVCNWFSTLSLIVVMNEHGTTHSHIADSNSQWQYTVIIRWHNYNDHTIFSQIGNTTIDIIRIETANTFFWNFLNSCRSSVQSGNNKSLTWLKSQSEKKKWVVRQYTL